MMTPTSQTINPSLQEWRRYWPLVLSALVGSSFAALPIQSIAFFIDPIAHDLGWSRTKITIGLTIYAIVIVPLSPVVGGFIDRWGARPMAVAGIALGALTLASLGLTSGLFAMWVAQWTFFAIIGLSIKTTVWTAAVTSVFESARGMALAVTLCGTAVSQTLSPLLSYWLIERAGWRAAYMILGLGWGGLALILVALFFYDGRKGAQSVSMKGEATRAATDAAQGLTVKQALRCVPLYRISLALVISSSMSVAVVTNKVGILGEMGISRGVAAQIAATAGLAGISGKLFSGWLYDRSSSQWIGIAAFGVPALGFALMLDPIRTPTLLVVGMILLGLGAGAALQATVYLTARYGGLKHFGKIFGTVGVFTVLGVGLGPLLGGVIYDHFHSYSPLITLGIPLGTLSGVLVAGLGAYPDWTARAADELDPIRDASAVEYTP